VGYSLAKPGMKIAIEVSNAIERQPSGIGRYVLSLLAALDTLNTAELMLLFRLSRWMKGTLPAGRNFRYRLFTKSTLQSVFAKTYQADCLLCPAYTLPHPGRMPVVAVIHDLHLVKGINVATAGRDQPAHRAVKTLEAYVDRCSQLIFISKHVQDEFLRTFHFDRSRTHVIYHGVAPTFRPRTDGELNEFRQRYRLYAPFLLFPGDPKPSKNIERMMEAYSQSGARTHYDLVLSGKISDSRRSALTILARHLGIQNRVRFLNYLPDHDLPLAFSAASGLLFVSLDEGFGMPILEAMASKIPVLTSDVTSCPEIAAGYAILANPVDVEQIRRGIEQLPQLSQDRLEAARRYANGMSWQATAQRTFSVLEQAASTQAVS